MNPINPHFARSMANQRIQEHLDQAATQALASKESRRRFGAVLAVRLWGRQGRPVRVRARIPGRAY